MLRLGGSDLDKKVSDSLHDQAALVKAALPFHDAQLQYNHL